MATGYCLPNSEQNGVNQQNAEYKDQGPSKQFGAIEEQSPSEQGVVITDAFRPAHRVILFSSELKAAGCVTFSSDFGETCFFFESGAGLQLCINRPNNVVIPSAARPGKGSAKPRD